MQAYRKSEGTAPLMLNVGSRLDFMFCWPFRPLYRRDRTPVPIELKDG